MKPMKKKTENLSLETLAIHGAQEKDQYQALSSPIYMTSAFAFENVEEAEATFNFEKNNFVYTRGRNPTVDLFEKRLSLLENGAGAVAFASGMAAITTVMFSLIKEGGGEIIAHHTLYGSTHSALVTLFQQFGIKTTLCDLTNVQELSNKINKNTKVIFFETPANPSMDVIDITKISEIAHTENIKVVVDNTMLTPCFQKPLNLGADVVVHSATKYLCGHGDALGGAAVSKDPAYLASLKFEYMCELGAVLSPFNAWLFLRGMKTLPIRMKKHEENALFVLTGLQKLKQVQKIFHPSLPAQPGYEVAKKQMTGFGGIISFELEGTIENTKKFIAALVLAKFSVSFGDAETLIQVPYLMTHRSYIDQLGKSRFSAKTIRISVGLEDPQDILNDIEQALLAAY